MKKNWKIGDDIKYNVICAGLYCTGTIIAIDKDAFGNTVYVTSNAHILYPEQLEPYDGDEMNTEIDLSPEQIEKLNQMLNVNKCH